MLSPPRSPRCGARRPVPIFPVIDGRARRPDKVRPDNLYEYINGGADAFLQDFGLNRTHSSAQVVVTADCRHRDPTRVRDVLAGASADAPIPIGIEGYAGKRAVRGRRTT